MGLDPESQEGIDARKQLLDATRIPEEEESWSTTWRSDNPEEFSARSRQTPILLNDKTKMIAEKLGLDITDGMSGADFIAEIVEYRSKAEGAAWNAVRYNYGEYTDNRGRAFSMAESTLNDLSQNPRLDPNVAAPGRLSSWTGPPTWATSTPRRAASPDKSKTGR